MDIWFFKKKPEIYTEKVQHFQQLVLFKLGGCVFFLPYGWINVFHLAEGFYQKVNIQESMKATELEQYVSEQALNCLS